MKPRESVYSDTAREDVLKDSVEDKVHSVLSERLEDIFDMFGQIPDTLGDV